MEKNRLEAFSDGVIAILITIMVLELHTPEGTSFKSLFAVLPLFVSYLLSFIYLGIYWVNHHRIFSNVRKVTPTVLWANLFFLFWLSLIPFSTTWMSNHFDHPFPTGFYGIILFVTSLSFRILEGSITHKAEHTSDQHQFIANGLREQVSSAVYLLCWPLAYLSVWFSFTLLYLIAVWWIFPDKEWKRIRT